MNILQMSNLALRFVLELVALWIYGYWAFNMGSTWLSKLLWGVSIPFGIAVLWGVFGSPKAVIPLIGGLHFLLELTVFGCPVFLLWMMGKPNMAIVYGVMVGLNKVLLKVLA